MLTNVGSVVAAILAVAAAAAQGQPREQREPGLDEIVVTARKRAEPLQDVPLTVTALTAEELERGNVQGLADIALRTPGLNYEGYVASGLSGGVVLRGLTNTQLVNRTQNVAVFYDGVYLPNQAMFDLGVADIERVEVLKGPQSALYGRNAFAGTINYISRKPANEWHGDFVATAGNFDREDYSAFLTGPLSPGRVLFKLSWAHTESGGTWRNGHPLAAAGVRPGNRGRLGGWDTDSWSAGLTVIPFEAVEVNLGYFRTDIAREPAANYTLQGAGANQFALTPFNDLNCLPRTVAGAPANTAFCGELPVQRPQVAGDGRLPGIVVDPRQLGLNGEDSIRTASVRWAPADALEAVYLFGRADYAGHGGGPSDRDPVRGSNVQFLVGSPVPVLRNLVDSRPNSTVRATSHELRVSSAATDLALSWLAGAYYSDVAEATTGLTLFAPPLGTASLAPAIRTSNQSAARFEDRIRALFGSLEWRFAQGWWATAEARYNDEDKEVFRLTDSVGAPVIDTPAAPNNTYQRAGFDSVTWRGTLGYRPQPGLLAYLSAARGEKAGGFNVARNPEQAIFGPETNVTYELGLKSEWLARRLRFNGALYYIDWEDIQGGAPQRGPGVVPTDANVIENRGGARSRGIEVELSYLFGANFSATLAAAWNDPQYRDATFLSTVACDGVRCTPGSIDAAGIGNGNIDGNALERQSKRQGTLLLTYADRLPNGWGYYGNLDLTHQSEQYLEPLNLGSTGERTLVNARLGLAQDNWEVALWSKNLLDEKYVASSLVVFVANSYVVALGDRRTYGITARVRF